MEMNLVMPNNDVELEQEEMMYVDGGFNFFQPWNTVYNVEVGIDIFITLISAGAGIYQGRALKKYSKANSRKWVKTVYPVVAKYIGTAVASILTATFDIIMATTGNSTDGLIARKKKKVHPFHIMAATGNSTDGLIASGIDIVDGKRNGIVFG